MFLDRSSGGSRAGATWPSSLIVAALLICASTTARAQAPEVALQFSPAQTSIKFTLGDILHTVRGSFILKHGAIEYDLASASVRGALVVDATSGQSNNRTRDRKMHREILESERYPEISFRPNRVEGKVAPAGVSSVQVHGMFTIHGAEHELTMPVRVEISPDHWTATTHFIIPYVKWGIKNPSTFLLRVSESVAIEIHATGSNPLATSGTH